MRSLVGNKDVEALKINSSVEKVPKFRRQVPSFACVSNFTALCRNLNDRKSTVNADMFGLPPATAGWLLILFGCCANVLSLEFITKRDTGAGNLVTFAQFSFIAIEGFFGQFDTKTWSLAPRKIPIVTYGVLTGLFLCASVLNNMALNYNISMPVHTVFRSSGLAGTLLTGFLFFGKRYSKFQITACLLVCVGVTALTIADSNGRQQQKTEGCCGQPAPLTAGSDITPAVDGVGRSGQPATILEVLTPHQLPYLGLGPLLSTVFTYLSTYELDWRWALGIAMLTATLFMLATLGHIQDKTYATYGKVWREVMFYTHALSLPFLCILGRDIWDHAMAWFEPDLFVPVTLPNDQTIQLSLYVFLLINLITQSVCFKGVAILTSHTSALTTSVALTLRKFISLVLSILYFGNAFTATHWIGAILVFTGIIAYSNEKWFKAQIGMTVSEEENPSTPMSSPAVAFSASYSAAEAASADLFLPNAASQSEWLRLAQMKKKASSADLVHFYGFNLPFLAADGISSPAAYENSEVRRVDAGFECRGGYVRLATFELELVPRVGRSAAFVSIKYWNTDRAQANLPLPLLRLTNASPETLAYEALYAVLQEVDPTSKVVVEDAASHDPLFDDTFGTVKKLLTALKKSGFHSSQMVRVTADEMKQQPGRIDNGTSLDQDDRQNGIPSRTPLVRRRKRSSV